MAYHSRIETKDYSSFITSRARNSELWFVNNPTLEAKILSYLAKYAHVYGVLLYAFSIEGNHIHIQADFPNLNRGDFKRDLNSMIAKLVPIYCPSYPGGKFFERRYSVEIVPHHQEDIEDRVLYIALQAVQDGLVERISDYPGYNFFHDAIHGIEREHKVVDWTEFHRAERCNPGVSIKEYETTYELKFERIPGYKHLSKKEYSKLMSEKLEERRSEVVRERLKLGKGFLGRERLKMIRPGSRPVKTKKSDRNTHRPRVLSKCNERRALAKTFYFTNLCEHKKCSRKYRDGDLSVIFPPGMYKPYIKPPPTLSI